MLRQAARHGADLRVDDAEDNIDPSRWRTTLVQIAKLIGVGKISISGSAKCDFSRPERKPSARAAVWARLNEAHPAKSDAEFHAVAKPAEAVTPR